MILLVFIISLIWYLSVRKKYAVYVDSLKWLDILFISRVFGTICYYIFAFYFTNGNVDAFVYTTWGNNFADYFVNFDFSPISDPVFYRGGEFFYTNFVNYPTALFLILTGRDVLSVYYLYSLVSFTGLLYLIKSFAVFSNFKVPASTLKYFLLIPAFWFWNSTIGKDAPQFLGFGIFVYGLVYKKNNLKKIFIIFLGLFISYSIRPPFALLLLMAWGASYFINFRDKGFTKILKIGFGIAIAFVAIYFIQQRLQIENLSVETISQSTERFQSGTDYGSGRIEGNSFSPGGIVMSFVNVLMRPFPWEMRNFNYLLAGIEIYIILFLFIRGIINFNSKLPLSKFFLFWILIFSVVIGLSENNIGTMARHRSLIFTAVVGLYYLGEVNKWNKKNNLQS